jgi:superfamily II DNA or RNA helicase
LSKISNLVEVHKAKSADDGDIVEKSDYKKEKGSIEQQQTRFFSMAHSKTEDVIQPSMLVGGTLKDYQMKGLQWMVSLYNSKLNGILADEMGLGKTIQTIGLICYLMEFKKVMGPFLIVVPLSTLSNWVNEFEKWAPDIIKVVFKGNIDTRKELVRTQVEPRKFNVLLTTYEYIMKDKKDLRKPDWRYIIVDEGHRMKNANSKFAVCLSQEYTSRNRILLTGTPLQNSLPELWALLNFLLPSIFNSAQNFEEWFSKPFQNFAAGESDKTVNVELSVEEKMLVIQRLHSLLRPFLLRRVKKEVLDQMPAKTEKVIKCELSAWQRIVYKQIKEQGAVVTRSKGGNSARGLSNILMQLRKIVNHPYLFTMEDFELGDAMIRASGKFELLDRLLPKLKACGHRVLLFTQFTSVLDLLEHYLRYRSHHFLRLDGNTSADFREQRMYQFNAPDSPYFIFILSTRSGGLGINLATADTVVIFDSDWNPQMDAQAQDRAHRIGQKNEVRVFRLITNSPVEEKILAKANSKLGLENLVIGAGQFDKEKAAVDDDDESDAKNRANLIRELLEEDLEEATEEDQYDNAQLNDVIARGDAELEFFTQWDIAKQAADDAKWIAQCKEEGLDPNKEKRPSHLMESHEIPEWVTGSQKELDHMKENKYEYELSSGRYGRGTRDRKEVIYAEVLNDNQFTDLLESGATLEEIESERSRLAQKERQRSVSDRRRRNMGGLSPEELKETLLEAFGEVCNLTAADDDDGDGGEDADRKLCDLFMELPAEENAGDYYDIIKDPICLNEIKDRIERMEYSVPSEYSKDMEKVFDNAAKYNARGTYIWNDAKALNRNHKKVMQNLFGHDFFTRMNAAPLMVLPTKKRTRRTKAEMAAARGETLPTSGDDKSKAGEDDDEEEGDGEGEGEGEEGEEGGTQQEGSERPEGAAPVGGSKKKKRKREKPKKQRKKPKPAPTIGEDGAEIPYEGETEWETCESDAEGDDVRVVKKAKPAPEPKKPQYNADGTLKRPRGRPVGWRKNKALEEAAAAAAAVAAANSLGHEDMEIEYADISAPATTDDLNTVTMSQAP